MTSTAVCVYCVKDFGTSHEGEYCPVCSGKLQFAQGSYAFERGGAAVLERPKWNGVERRLCMADRRKLGHDRRWEASRGRRFRAGDRRRR